MSGEKVLLSTERLSCSFGALQAVSDVSLDFRRGEIHAIIGPNGAGKTTFINLLSGELKPVQGRVRFNGRDIAGLPNRISQLGIGRSYQKTNIFYHFTCLKNCWLAAQSRLPNSMRFFRGARHYRSVENRARRALELCRLRDRADAVVSTMSYGEQRQLEIAMMLATEPSLLLLDEPLAGMGAEESQQMIELLKQLAAQHTLILVEHDMEAVFAIAERISVMVNGTLLETGAPEEIRASQAVQEAYLGGEAHA